MAMYTKLIKKDIDKVNEYYGLSIDEFEPMLGGAGNSSFICNAQSESFVVTVCDEKSFTDVENLGKLLQHLENENFPTTELVSPTDGKNPIMRIFDKPLMVKRFIPGEVIENFTKNNLFQTGAMMAKLHKISPPTYLENEQSYGKHYFPSLIGKNFDKQYEDWLDGKLKFLNKNIPGNLPKSLIHGDLFFDNILFKNNNLTAIIDFEEACYYYRVFDIGMGIVGITLENDKLNLEKAKIFIKGYQSVSNLEEIEKVNLKLFIEYAAIATSFWYFRNYNVHYPNGEKGNQHLSMKNIAKSVNSIPDDVINTRLY